MQTCCIVVDLKSKESTRYEKLFINYLLFELTEREQFLSDFQTKLITQILKYEFIVRTKVTNAKITFYRADSFIYSRLIKF